MWQAHNLMGKKVLKIKQGNKQEKKLVRVGKARMILCDPSGRRVVGLLVKQPDIAGMVKRPDIFIALDGLHLIPEGILIDESTPAIFDDEARKRLGLDWDACIMWSGMDAKTQSNKELGYVNNFVFDEKSGAIDYFCIGDGSVAQSLVGSLCIPAALLKGYAKGFMIVDDAAANLELSGGVAARAGEGYAKAKIAGKDAAKAAGEATAKAVDKGSHALGKSIGDLKRASIEAKEAYKAEAPKPKGKTTAGKTTAGKTKTISKNVQKPASAQAAREVGKQLNKMGKMFSAFANEYKKSSK